jgi:Glycine rich protein
MKQITTLLSLIAILLWGNLNAQQNVGIGTTSPHASAALDVTATGKGMLVPRMSAANRPTSPATGLLIYQTDVDSGFYYYNGAAWKYLPQDQVTGNGSLGQVSYFTSANKLSGSNLLFWDTAKLRLRIGPDTAGTHKLNVAGTAGVKISSTNSGTGYADWIALNVGSADVTKDRLVAGLLNGVPAIGAQNAALSGWKPISISPLGGLAVGGTVVEPSAIMDVRSEGNNQGVIFPRLNQVQRDAITSPANGLMIFQTDNKAGVYRYNGSSWLFLADATVAVVNVGTQQTANYAFTGAVQTFTVPAAVNQVTITARGAAGSYGVIHQPNVAIQYPAGGLGGTATGTFAVTPGQVFNIYVGGAPAAPPTVVAASNTVIPGGYNGGGNAMAELSGGINYIPGGGGGATDVRLTGNALADRILVAGGGGGSTQRTFGGTVFAGGTGGGTTGGNGVNGGAGGTQSTGNALGVGGSAIANNGAGAGGGYWGGNAGGTDGGGGGGSSYFLPSATATSTTAGNITGNGSLTITYFVQDTVVNFNSTIEGSRIINLNASNINTGIIAPARLGTGTPSASNYLRGDGTWATVGTNLLSGTGVTWQLCRYDFDAVNGNANSTKIKGSIIQDNGTSVSIGNVSPSTFPQYQLHNYKQQLTATGDGQTTTMSYRTRDYQNDGTGYGQSVTNRGSSGYNFWGDVYTFGDASYNYNDWSRCGGNLGAYVDGSYWGSAGYRSSGSLNYGFYSSGANPIASGSGRFSSTQPAKGIGGGFVGDLMGSWSKGDVMGSISEGKLFASYNIGNAITDGKNIELVTTADGEKIPTYSVSSATVAKIYNDGTGQLTNGKARVNFDAAFLATLAKDAKPTITITPVGGWANLYIAKIDATGFDVAEANNGTSNIEFNFIAVGKKLSLNETPVSSEVLNKNFSKNLPDVLFNEGNTKASAKPMWWDGTKFNYTTPPLNAPELEAQRKKKELIAQEEEALRKQKAGGQ